MHDNDTIRDTLLAAFRSVLPPRTAVYVAGPLATGKEFYCQKAHPVETHSTLRSRNAGRLVELVDKLRSSQSAPVIDPSIIQFSSRNDREVGDFFLLVISEFVKELWFVDEWEYSHGATKEFLLSVKLGLPSFGENGEVITPVRALALLDQAVSFVRGINVDASKLEQRREMLLDIALK